MFRRSAPPPESTMPLSMTSEASSGGVSSSTLFTAAMICWRMGSIASVISLLPMVIVRGSPAIRSRPRTSMVSSGSIGRADPIWIFTSSAVRSPIMRL